VKLVVSKEALADIERLRAFLDEKEEAAAQHAVAVLQRAVGSLEIFPGRGRPSGIPGVGELVVPFGRSAYVVRYFADRERERVVIVRVWHGRETRG
jgi:plasmid stabilization system protein ParE